MKGYLAAEDQSSSPDFEEKNQHIEDYF